MEELLVATLQQEDQLDLRVDETDIEGFACAMLWTQCKYVLH